jgi:hypothetical protein
VLLLLLLLLVILVLLHVMLARHRGRGRTPRRGRSCDVRLHSNVLVLLWVLNGSCSVQAAERCCQVRLQLGCGEATR